MKILRKPKIEDIVCNIQNNEEDKEAFIVQYQPFIRKSISSVCRRYITEQDELKELNIPSNKLIVAFGNYGYDWKVNSKEPAKSLTFQKLW